MRISRLPDAAMKLVRREFKSICWKVSSRIRSSAQVSTRQGLYRVHFADRAIGKELYCNGEFELELIEKTFGFLRNELAMIPPKGEGILLDVGANIGVISIGALVKNQMAGAIAIEPDPKNFSTLKTNIELNHQRDRITCLQNAVSHQTGVLQFELSQTNYGDHRVRSHASNPTSDCTSESERYKESTRQLIEVHARRIDDLLGSLPETLTSKISLLWIDIQGFEGYAFQGAPKLLSRNIPVVAEIWPYGIHRAGMSTEQFCDIAEGYWKSFWVWRRRNFVQYPINLLNTIFLELGNEGDFDNVIFTNTFAAESASRGSVVGSSK